jgi:hypothetical protein
MHAMVLPLRLPSVIFLFISAIHPKHVAFPCRSLGGSGYILVARYGWYQPLSALLVGGANLQVLGQGLKYLEARTPTTILRLSSSEAIKMVIRNGIAVSDSGCGIIYYKYRGAVPISFRFSFS